MACAFVSTLSVPEGKQFFMIFNQASHHQKQRAKRPRKSKPIPKFSRQPPRFHGCFAFILQRNTVDPRAMQAYTLSTLSKDGYRKDTDT